MSDSTIAIAKLTKARSGLACRLHPRQPLRELSPIAGEVEVENTGHTAVEVEVRTSPLQYLNLIVADADGNVVSDAFYGDQFSPLTEPYAFRLEPGEKFTGPVSFLGNVPEKLWRPGEYTVRAVYEYNGMTAVSEPLRVRLAAQQSAGIPEM
jgi:hypothetical protein